MSSQSFSEGKKFIYLFIYNNYITIQSDHLEFHVHTGLNVMGMTLGQIWPERTYPFMKISPCGNPITLKILSSCSWWYGLLVLISSWRQWNIGSHVNNSAKIHPIAHISGERVQWKELDGITTCAISSPCMIPRHVLIDLPNGIEFHLKVHSKPKILHVMLIISIIIP